MEKALLKSVLQLGIVVPDARQAAEAFCQLFALDSGQIVYYDMRKGTMPMTFRGKPTEAYNAIATVQAAGLEFEFIQDLGGGENAQKEFLDQCGPGLQHICIQTTEHYDEMLSRMQAAGAEVLVAGGDGDVGYCYLDLRPSMGLVFELYNDRLAQLRGV